MGKFKVRFKVEKLELEVEGEKDSVPEVTHALEKQMSSLLTSPALLAGAHPMPDGRPTTPHVIELPTGRKSKRRASSKTQTETQEALPEFRHDPNKWGNPQQAWTTAEKSIWLLFVVKNQSETKELSASAIATLFNKHFRESGAIRRGNVWRDLGKCKSKSPPWVGEDATQDPYRWYLTETGDKVARDLVAKATGAVPATNGA